MFPTPDDRLNKEISRATAHQVAANGNTYHQKIYRHKIGHKRDGEWDLERWRRTRCYWYDKTLRG